MTLPNNKHIYISEVYAPSNSPKARHYFFEYLDRNLAAEDPTIVVGDFNNVEDPDEDIVRTNQIDPIRQINEDLSTFFAFCATRQLTDSYLSVIDDEIWEPRLMTNKSQLANGATTYSRIDRFYHSPQLHDKVYIENFTCRTTDTQPINIVSTHNPIDLTIQLEEPEEDIPCYHGVWRMNVYIATQTKVKNRLIKLKNLMYNQCKNSTPAEIVDHLIKFKKRATNILKGIQDEEARERAKLKENLKAKMEYASHNSSQEIEIATARYHEILDYEDKAAEIRSRCKKVEGASKNSKYHFVMATKNHKKSLIKMVLKRDGSETNTWDELAETVTDYWEKAVLNYRPICLLALADVEGHVVPLSPLDRAILGSDAPPAALQILNNTVVSVPDVFNSISSSPLSKSPGIDGLPIEFYQLLIEDHENENNCVIAEWLHVVYNHAFHTGLLPEHMRQSQIRLLYKKVTEFDKRYPKNYRPIALLNVDYKILSKILFNKLKPLMPKMISEDQFCVPKRYMGDLIHIISSTIHHINHPSHKRRGFLLFLDFEKAFDSVNHEFMERMLVAHGLPSEFVRWILLAFTQTQASCIINGKRGRFFDLPGGGRQGDNLYPLIFAIVMQALNSLIHSKNLTGIAMADDIIFKLKQYADDSTLFGSTREDYVKIKEALDTFCKASGMRINWEKSTLMWLGEYRNHPFALPAGDQIQILRENQQLRVLGIHLGHTQTINSGWVRLKDKMNNVLNNNLLKVGNEIGDTITINAVLIGSAVFNAQYEAISRSNYATIERWAKFFIRKRNSLTQDAKRYQSRHHGNPVPLIKLLDLVDTLMARWTSRILTPGPRPAYACNWLHELNAIAKYLQYDSLDHLLLSSKLLPDLTTTKLPFQLYTYYSLRAFKRMGFSRKIPLTWEEIASQPIFDNPRIVNPITLKPWVKSSSVFGGIRGDKLKYLWQLSDFDRHQYNHDPEVPRLNWLSTQAVNTNMRYGNNHFNINHISWANLRNSIPQEWQTCLKRGNLGRHQEGDFLATLLVDGSIGDVYKFHAGLLQHFAMGPHASLLDQHDSARPGTRDRHGRAHWPSLNNLKKLRVLTDSSSNPPTYSVVSFLFQSPANLEVYQSNVFSNAYEHPTITSTGWRDMAKEWRESLHSRHRHTENFANATFGDPQYDLFKLTTQFNALVTESKRIETLWKIMNKSLYIGDTGRNYQLNIKKVPPNDPRALAGNCIFSGHVFNPLYRAVHRTTNPRPIPATYAHILWTGHTADLVWKEADLLAVAMNIPPVTRNLNSYQDVFRYIESADLTDEATIITSNLMIEAIWTLYAREKELNDLYKNGTIVVPDKVIDLWPRRSVAYFRYRTVDLALSHRHTMKIVRSREMTVRNKLLRDTRHYTKLTNDELAMYTETWLKTDLVQITNGALVVKPFRREPP